MNGRIYDPTLGRFLQADPFIQAPLNSQNYNRYSYVLNNPLSYTDPSGYFFKSLWKGVKSAFRAIAKVPILNAALQFAACSFGGPAGCAAYAAISTYAVTGSLKGALIGAFTAGIGGGQGFFTVGLIGGLASRAQGGNFGHGFWSAGLGALLGGRIKLGNPYANVLVSAVVGGTISKITGGKFSNGAQTWAFSAAIAQDWNDDFGTSSYEKIEEELANLTDEQKDSNFKRNYESFKRGIEAVGEALGLETPDNIVVVGMDDIDGNLAAVECSVFLGCLNQVKVSREFLQLNRTSYDFLETAYHEVLHFNDTRWNIFLNSDSRHNQIIRQSEMVHFVTPRWVEQGIHGANEALRVRTQFERIENN